MTVKVQSVCVSGGRKSISWLSQRAGERSDPKGRNKVSEGQSSHRKCMLFAFECAPVLCPAGQSTFSCVLYALCAHVSLCSGVAFIWIMSLYAAVAASASLRMCYAVDT